MWFETVLGSHQERDRSMKRTLFPRDRRCCASVRFTSIAPVIMTAAAFALASPVFAQSSLDSPAAPDKGYAMPPPDADLSAAPPAPPDGAHPMAATDDGSGSVSDDDPAAHSDWDRDDAGEAGADNGDLTSKVLELPQVLDPADAKASNDGDGNQAALDGGAASSQDQLGSVDDYRDQVDSTVAGVYVAPVPVRPMVTNPYGVSVYRMSRMPVNPRNIPMYPRGTVIIRPGANGMNSAIGTTSPMLTPPHRSMALPGGGWWTRTR
jgi:hypothetical protein